LFFVALPVSFRQQGMTYFLLAFTLMVCVVIKPPVADEKSIGAECFCLQQTYYNANKRNTNNICIIQKLQLSVVSQIFEDLKTRFSNVSDATARCHLMP